MSEAASQIEVQAGQAATAPGAGEELVVKCARLSKIFRDFWLRSRVKAVDGIDLEVRRGEIFGLLGPNGSGKSTAIKMILGLLHPTSGHIAVFGRHPREVAIKNEIGYLPEESYLYRFLSARETLDYYARLFHIPRRIRSQRIDTLLEYVGLDRVGTRPVGEYSKGMQRRIGLAQALINDPQFLILDEPTTGLDPIGTRQIKDLILQLRRRGKTILLCSHLLADVEDVCDRVAIMFGGKVRREGTVDELLTEQDRTELELDQLSEADIEALEQFLSQRGKHVASVKRPRQRLEQLFLQIVNEAQSQGMATSGATSGGAMAEFLRGEDEAMLEAEAERPEAMIDKLVRGDAAKQPPRETDAPVAEAKEGELPDAEEPAGSEAEVLEQLTGGSKKEPEQEQPRTRWASLDGKEQVAKPADEQQTEPSEQDEAEADAQEDEVDRSVLDSLVWGKRRDEDKKE